MRISFALALYVSLAASALPDEINNNWAAVHGAGIEADEHGNYDQAIGYFRQCWSLAQGTVERGICASDLGQAYRGAKRSKEAIEWLERAHAIWLANPGAGRLPAVTEASLADLYRDAGDYGRAEALLREALAVPNENPDLTDGVRNNLADLLREEGRSGEARQLFALSLERSEISWQQRINALAGLADLNRRSGNRNASEKEWNEVVEIAQGRGDSISEAIALRGLASLWLSAGNPARAEPLFRRSLAILENDPKAAPQDIATSLFNLAQLYRDQNKLALAQDAWSRVLRIERQAFGDMHPQVAETEEMLAEVYAQRGQYKIAFDYATNAVESMRCLFGGNAMPTAVAFANRGTVERLAGDLDSALKDYQRAIAITRMNPRNELLQRSLVEKYAALLKAAHREKEAKSELSMLTAVQ